MSYKICIASSLVSCLPLKVRKHYWHHLKTRDNVRIIAHIGPVHKNKRIDMQAAVIANKDVIKSMVTVSVIYALLFGFVLQELFEKTWYPIAMQLLDFSKST